MAGFEAASQKGFEVGNRISSTGTNHFTSTSDFCRAFRNQKDKHSSINNTPEKALTPRTKQMV